MLFSEKMVVCSENEKKQKNMRREFDWRVKRLLFLNCLTPKIKATPLFETSLYFHPVTEHKIPEDLSCQQRHCENRRPHGEQQYISPANTDLSNVK